MNWDARNIALVTIFAILALTVLEIAAMITDHDGALLIPIVTIIAGMAGFSIGLPINTKSDNVTPK
jgi:hypothetical protein